MRAERRAGICARAGSRRCGASAAALLACASSLRGARAAASSRSSTSTRGRARSEVGEEVGELVCEVAAAREIARVTRKLDGSLASPDTSARPNRVAPARERLESSRRRARARVCDDARDAVAAFVAHADAAGAGYAALAWAPLGSDGAPTRALFEWVRAARRRRYRARGAEPPLRCPFPRAGSRSDRVRVARARRAALAARHGVRLVDALERRADAGRRSLAAMRARRARVGRARGHR